MSDIGWTDSRVDILKKLWLDGLSASQLAKQLGGVTRNAVIGKIHRLGLSGRAMPSKPARAPRTPPRPRVTHPTRLHSGQGPRAGAPRFAPTATVIVLDEGPGLIACMTGLHAHVCKWPIGDPKADTFSFCGLTTAGESPYCAGHAAVAYRPGKLAPLERDPVVRRALSAMAA